MTREVEGSDGKMQTVTEWQYDEKEMTVKEYENMALMKILVESLKRMYKKGTLTKEQISERVAKGSISADEYEYITGEKFSGGDTE